jgi:hypothetical protein
MLGWNITEASKSIVGFYKRNIFIPLFEEFVPKTTSSL